MNCIECLQPLTVHISISPTKVFFCENPTCPRRGLLSVIGTDKTKTRQDGIDELMSRHVRIFEGGPTK